MGSIEPGVRQTNRAAGKENLLTEAVIFGEYQAAKLVISARLLVRPTPGLSFMGQLAPLRLNMNGKQDSRVRGIVQQFCHATTRMVFGPVDVPPLPPRW